MTAPRAFWIDTDTASDDAVALIMALRHRDADVVGISVVSGNVPVEQGTRNALYTVERCGRDTPVHAGAARPLIRPPDYAFFFHGRDGMGDQHYPAPRRHVESAGAVPALVAAVRSHPGLTLVTLGPLTNVALALRSAPDLVPGVARCVVMGGTACAVGNVTPAAEFNMWVDPEAAREVIRSGLPIEMVGWELCRGPANLLPDEMDRIRALDTPLARFALDCNRTALRATFEQSRDPGLGLPDPVAMAVALEPTVCTRKSRHLVDVETEGDLTRGMTVVDALGVAGDLRNREIWGPLAERGPNVEVCWEIDVRRWKGMLVEALR